MRADKKKKFARIIKVDSDKCSGCRVCEMMCSSSHSDPKYSCSNPARSRIRVIRDPLTDKFIPVFAGAYTAAKCTGREKYIIAGKEYDECAFCKASCPQRQDFKEPDSGLPLKCDRCQDEEEPLCVKYCYYNALTLEESEEEEKEADMMDQLEVGLESLANKYGLKKIVDALGRISKNK